MINQIPNHFPLLETISINEGITEIGENVFSGITTSTTLNLPSTIEYISGGAFQKCYNIKPILSKDNSHITYYEDAFYTIPNSNSNPKTDSNPNKNENELIKKNDLNNLII